MRLEWIVSQEMSGRKLIDFLKASHEDKTLSLRQIKRWVDRGLCSVNGTCQRFSAKPIAFRDRVTLVLPEENENRIQFDESNILYEDDSVLAYNKPMGLACDPKSIAAFFPNTKLLLAHRLDKDTTGVVLLGKTPEIRDAIMDQFKVGKIKKEYLAIVDHTIIKNKGSIVKQLAPKRHYQGQTVWSVVQEEGLYARTDWECVKKAKTASLVRLFPLTGRTHQIRVHMSSIGHPLLGDRQYGGHASRAYESWSYFLHAEKISFVHPITHQRILITAPLPKQFQDAVCAIFG